MTPSLQQTPIACTLGADDLRVRFRRIAALAREHLLVQRQEGLTLDLLYRREAMSELARIVTLERECCALLTFELAELPHAVALRITAPPEAGEFATALFEHFSASEADAVAPRCDLACGCRGATMVATP